jgi:hypothetical protein
MPIPRISAKADLVTWGARLIPTHPGQMTFSKPVTQLKFSFCELESPISGRWRLDPIGQFETFGAMA